MNILYIAHERNMGGASKCLIDLVCGMKSKGHQVYVMVPVKNCNVQKKLEEKGIAVWPVFFLWWQVPSYWNVSLKIIFRLGYLSEYITLYQAIRYVKKYKVEVIHSNSSVIDFGMKLAERCHVRHIWHFREFGDLDYRLEYFKGKKESLQQLNNSNSRIVFISKRLKEYYSNYVDEEKSIVIYDGIEDKEYEVKRRNRKDKVIFLVAGNFHRNKRQSIVIEAGKLLQEEGYCNFELWFAGQVSAMQDSKLYERELREAALPLGENVKFLGFIKDMEALRKSADVEIVPSAEEAFGRVTVEAMLSEMPVIGSDSGATPELIMDNVTGTLFESGDIEQLKEKMKIFLENGMLIEKLGKAGRNHALKNFGLNRNLDEIEKLYRENE